jgi:hypothetical protein
MIFHEKNVIQDLTDEIFNDKHQRTKHPIDQTLLKKKLI